MCAQFFWATMTINRQCFCVFIYFIVSYPHLFFYFHFHTVGIFCCSVPCLLYDLRWTFSLESYFVLTLSLRSMTPVFISLLSSGLSFTSASHSFTQLLLPLFFAFTLTPLWWGEARAGLQPRPISPSLAAMCSSPEIITISQWHHSNASLMID